MNLQGLNLETLLHDGYIVNPYLNSPGKSCDLCAVVGYKERLRERGVRGAKVKWFWSAYLIINQDDYFNISNAVSVGMYDRIVFMLVEKKPKNYWPIRPLTLEVGSSMDEDESGSHLFYKLRKGSCYEYE